MPIRALLLWSLLVPGLGVLGILLGSWPIPVAMSVVRDGFDGFHRIPVEWYGWAHPPEWFLLESGFKRYNLVDTCSGIVGLFFAAAFGLWATRIWRFLSVHKLHWATKDQVARFNRRRQWL